MFLTYRTEGKPFEFINITQDLQEAVRKQELQEGLIFVFVQSTTSGLNIIEFEKGHIKDIEEFLKKYIPSGPAYHHDSAWGDDNGYAHMRAFFLNSFLLLPFSSGRLQLGTWQNVVFFDFDNKPRERKILLRFLRSV